MGRHRWTTRLTVEQCRTLCVESMHRDGVFASPHGSSWTTYWKDQYGQVEAHLDYSVLRIADGRLVLGTGPDLIEGDSVVEERSLVGAIGFEPTTPCAQGRCATRLRYAPTLNDLGHVRPVVQD